MGQPGCEGTRGILLMGSYGRIYPMQDSSVAGEEVAGGEEVASGAKVAGIRVLHCRRHLWIDSFLLASPATDLYLDAVLRLPTKRDPPEQLDLCWNKRSRAAPQCKILRSPQGPTKPRPNGGRRGTLSPNQRITPVLAHQCQYYEPRGRKWFGGARMPHGTEWKGGRLPNYTEWVWE